jgi:hypothetical protein
MSKLLRGCAIAAVAGAIGFAAGGAGPWAKSFATHPAATEAAVSPYDLQQQMNHRNLPAQEIQDRSVVFN